MGQRNFITQKNPYHARLPETYQKIVDQYAFHEGSVEGAEAGAVIYSLLESAKSYGHNPQHYFEDLLQKIPTLKDQKNISQFLPANWKPPNTS